MGSGSGGPFADVPTKRLKAALVNPAAGQYPHQRRQIATELRHRTRISEQDRVKKARR